MPLGAPSGAGAAFGTVGRKLTFVSCIDAAIALDPASVGECAPGAGRLKDNPHKAAPAKTAATASRATPIALKAKSPPTQIVMQPTAKAAQYDVRTFPLTHQ